MKTLVSICLLLLMIASTWAADEKHGALAIDRSDGFYYGWAYDYSTREAAQQRALSECSKRGGNCSVVMDLFGPARCGAYHTVNGDVGTAYGWGRASSRAEAAQIAAAECRIRADGQSCSNTVWACNSASDKPSQAPAIDETAVRNAVRDYYDNAGEWAGQFRIDDILAMRIEGAPPTLTVHVKYRFTPLRGNSQSAGNDQRVFKVNVSNGRYRVVNMGANMSGRF